MATVHIEANKEDIANIVLMPGDPNRAEYIAKTYLKNVKLVNFTRKMTAYTGEYKNKKITIFPSGMGIGSMGIYSYELFKEYDVDTIIRIGSCGAYVNQVKINDVIIVDNSFSDSSYAKVINNYNLPYVPSDSNVNNIIIATSQKLKTKLLKGNIYSTDVFYEKENAYLQKVQQYGGCGDEMETYALFYNAKLLNKKAAALLTVTDTLYDKNDVELSPKEREQSLNTMISLALESTLSL